MKFFFCPCRTEPPSCHKGIQQRWVSLPSLTLPNTPPWRPSSSSLAIVLVLLVVPPPWPLSSLSSTISTPHPPCQVKIPPPSARNVSNHEVGCCVDISPKTTVEDITMMLVTGLTLRTPLLRCDEGALRFRPVMDNYPICDNDWPTGCIVFGRAIRFFSLWKKMAEKKIL